MVGWPALFIFKKVRDALWIENHINYLRIFLAISSYRRLIFEYWGILSMVFISYVCRHDIRGILVNLKNYMSTLKIGIRHEDKYLAETRAPLVPKHVAELIRKYGIEVYVQSSSKRVFSDKEYEEAGAKIVRDLIEVPVIFGVKEIPIDKFEVGKTYIFFAHVIKGQPYNMGMLRQMMNMQCNLIDYERVVDDFGRRLIFFGRYAGLAGAINTLWTLGLRLNYFGFKTPFLNIQQTHHYKDLNEARKEVSKVGQEILKKGLPNELLPLTIGVTGYGNVSSGVQEILSLLPGIEILPEDLLKLKDSNKFQNNLIYKVTFKEEHISAPNDPHKAFDLDEYYTHPENYHGVFEQYLPHLSVLINGIYWDSRYPRLMSRQYLKEKFSKEKRPKLIVVGDIACDPEGSIEATLKGTTIEDPIFVYHPQTHSLTSGYEGEGLQIMAVDILPSELPRDSSLGFSNILKNYVYPIAKANYNASTIDEIELPLPIKRALILHKGQLTPDYKYIQKYLE